MLKFCKWRKRRVREGAAGPCDLDGHASAFTLTRTALHFLPDGQIGDFPVQPLSQKYFASRFDQISFLICAIPSHTEGRFAIVTDVGGGMRWTLTMLLTRASDADGEVVWS